MPTLGEAVQDENQIVGILWDAIISTEPILKRILKWVHANQQCSLEELAYAAAVPHGHTITVTTLHAEWLLVPLWILLYLLILRYSIRVLVRMCRLLLSEQHDVTCAILYWSMILPFNCCISRFGFYHTLVDRYAAFFSYRSMILGSLNHCISRLGFYARLPLDFNTPLWILLPGSARTWIWDWDH